jgi:hypothetical protein
MEGRKGLGPSGVEGKMVVGRAAYWEVEVSTMLEVGEKEHARGDSRQALCR